MEEKETTFFNNGFCEATALSNVYRVYNIASKHKYLIAKPLTRKEAIKVANDATNKLINGEHVPALI